MIAQLIFVAVGLVSLSCHGAEQKVFAGTLSPDKHVVIIEERSGPDQDYYFARASDHRRLGGVLPDDQQEISNVGIVASWNARSTKVAVLLFHGTKHSELLLFTKDDAGQFQAVLWRQPDAEAVYQRRTGRHLPRPGDGHDEDAVGPWEDENTVRLVSGQCAQTKDMDRYIHLLTTFKATVRDRRATVSTLRLQGPFSDRAADHFRRLWGSRYFEEANE